MESPPDLAAGSRGIALFDLDGTLLAWDCQLLFRDFVVRQEPWRRIFLLIFLGFVPFASLLGSETMKRIFLAFLWKMPAARRRDYFASFADSVMPLIYPDVRELLEERRREGDLLVLASASPEGYVKEIGSRLGFDLSLGTPVEFGLLFPCLSNHKGAAKVKRFREVLPDEWWSGERLIRSRGFTDSTADLPMLAVCESATVVNPKQKLEDLAGENGWTIVRPRRPWRSKGDHAWRSLSLLLGVGKDPAGRDSTA